MTDEELISHTRELLFGHTFSVASLKSLELVREPLLTLRCKLQREFYQAREKLRHPKDKELTDFDRNTMLQAHTAELQERYELVKGLEELVKERVDLIKILMESK